MREEPSEQPLKAPLEMLAEAEEMIARGLLPEAEAKLRQASGLAPDSAPIANRLGVVLARQRRLEEAAGEFRRAIALDPKLAAAHSNLGNVHQEQGRYDEAVAAYEAALAIDPDYEVAHNNLAAAYKRKGDHARAVHHLKQAGRLRKTRIDQEMKEQAAGLHLGRYLLWGLLLALLLWWLRLR